MPIVLDKEKAKSHYRELVRNREKGFSERFDPFLLEKNPGLRLKLKRIMERLFEKRYKRILDIGCGSGYYFTLLSEYCERLEGIDFSPELIGQAKQLIKRNRLKNFNVRVSDSKKIPFADESFDCVFAMDVLHHFQELDKSVSEIHRVLKKGGVFVAIEPNALNPLILFPNMLRKEEIGVLRNFPTRMRKTMHDFRKMEIDYITYTYRHTFPFKAIEAAGRLIKNTPLKFFSTRLAIKAVK